MYMGFISFSLEQFVFVKLAVQFTVEEMVFLGGLEANTFHSLYIGRDDPSRRSGKLMLEGRTDSDLEIFHLLVALKAFSIRRIQHYQG